MLSGITNWVEDKASNLLTTGIQAGGTLAGNAVGGVGSLVEGAGKSAGSAVSGGIGGVGSRITGYGDGVKRSMSANEPTQTGAKKTAVKPSTAVSKTTTTAQKTTGSAGSAKKALPSTSGAQWTAPATSQKSTSTPKNSTAPVTRSQSATAQKLQSAGTVTTKPQSSGGTATRTTNTGGGLKPQSAHSTSGAKIAAPGSKSTSDGKIRISPQSMPKTTASKPGARTAARSTGPGKKEHDASDPLGIGQNFGDMSKNKQKGNDSKPQSYSQSWQSQPKSQSADQRKASAADPLAIGEEIGKIGQNRK